MRDLREVGRDGHFLYMSCCNHLSPRVCAFCSVTRIWKENEEDAQSQEQQRGWRVEGHPPRRSRSHQGVLVPCCRHWGEELMLLSLDQFCGAGMKSSHHSCCLNYGMILLPERAPFLPLSSHNEFTFSTSSCQRLSSCGSTSLLIDLRLSLSSPHGWEHLLSVLLSTKQNSGQLLLTLKLSFAGHMILSLLWSAVLSLMPWIITWDYLVMNASHLSDVRKLLG